jgi:thioester reductase-like protein
LLTDSSDEETNGGSTHSLKNQMIDLVSKYTPARTPGWVILLTGATGHLGAHLLDQLSHNTNVSQVICLSRPHQQQDPQHRQQQANTVRGITLSESAWAKVSFITSSQLQQPDLGLPHEEYRRLVRTVTHVVHNAWPMDFQRNLSSFEPQVQVVRRLVIFCEDCHEKQRRLPSPRLLLTSSIAVGARNSSGRLLEMPVLDPSTTANIGYAQAKWVCEQILIEAAKTRGDLLHPTIVRLGQLTGGILSRIWNSNEHFPAILKASQIIGSLPELTGVSNTFNL